MVEDDLGYLRSSFEQIVRMVGAEAWFCTNVSKCIYFGDEAEYNLTLHIFPVVHWTNDVVHNVQKSLRSELNAGWT